MTESTKVKRARYKIPENKEIKNINFTKTPRYQRIIYWIYFYKYLTAYNIASLLFLDEKNGDLSFSGKTRRSELKEVNFTGIQKNISHLWQHGYLQKWSVRNPMYYQNGSVADVYTLGKESIPILADMLGKFPDELNIPQFARKDKVHKGQPIGLYNYLSHNVEISNLLISLKLFSYFSYGTYKVIYSAYDKQIKEKISYYDSQGKFIRTNLIPDGLIIIENEITGDRSNFFIEIDRQTESLPVWLEKMNKYSNFYRDGKSVEFFQKFYENNPELTNNGQVAEKWTKNFRVICATTSLKRIENMVEKTIQNFRGGKGTNMFLYTLLDNFNVSVLKTTYSKSGNKYSYNDVNFDKSRILSHSVFYAGHEKYNKQPFKIFDV